MIDHTWHGLHAVPLQVGYEPIDWQPPSPRAHRVRVRRHSCECASVVYELCQAGGLMFIRRTVRSPDGDEAHETAWLTSARTVRLWNLLLQGFAG